MPLLWANRLTLSAAWAVRLWLAVMSVWLGRGGDAGGGGLDQTCLFQVFEGVFQTAPLGFFIGIVVVGRLCGFVQAFGKGECLFELGDGIVHIQHFAAGVLVLCADEYALTRPYGPQPSVLSSKPSPFSPRLLRLESTMWPRLSWDFW